MLSVDPNGQKWQSLQSLHPPSTSKIPACVVLEEGKFGIEQFFSKEIKTTPESGLSFQGQPGCECAGFWLEEVYLKQRSREPKPLGLINISASGLLSPSPHQLPNFCL